MPCITPKGTVSTNPIYILSTKVETKMENFLHFFTISTMTNLTVNECLPGDSQARDHLRRGMDGVWSSMTWRTRCLEISGSADNVER